MIYMLVQSRHAVRMIKYKILARTIAPPKPNILNAKTVLYKSKNDAVIIAL